MLTMRRPYVLDLLHVLDDDIIYDIYPKKNGRVNLEELKDVRVNKVELGNNKVIIYVEEY